jgi:hypothetical protein
VTRRARRAKRACLDYRAQSQTRRLGRDFYVWRDGRSQGLTAPNHQKLAKLLYLFTAEPPHVCQSAAELAWSGKSVRLQQGGDELLVMPWVRR